MALPVEKPKCEKCGSIDLAPMKFGNEPHERWHAERLPNAMRCMDCGHPMHHGGVK